MSAQDELGLVALLNKWADVLTIPSGDFVNEDLRRVAAALTSLIAERDGLAKALEQAKDDTARLDYLDSLNASLNARHGTKYGWAMVVNQNVNRVMFNFPRGADLSDYNPHGFRSCRTAIDQRMAETAAYRRALSLDTNKGDGV